MIKSFADKETAALFKGESPRSFGSDILSIALRKLAQLNRIERLDELRIPPSNRLEKLTGNRLGQHSIRINDK